MDCIRRPALIVNCGFARVSIYENSNPGRTGRKARASIDLNDRIEKFKSQFSDYQGYGIPENYFQPTLGKDNLSQFNRDSNKILDGFQLSFLRGHSRDTYLNEFSSLKWSQFPDSEKNEHTLSKCSRCFEQYKECQASFPLKLCYESKNPVINIDWAAQGLKQFTDTVVSELNDLYKTESTTSFTNALLKNTGLRLEQKKTSTEKQTEKRAMMRAITKEVNQCFAKKASITMLAEGESKRKVSQKKISSIILLA